MYISQYGISELLSEQATRTIRYDVDCHGTLSPMPNWRILGDFEHRARSFDAGWREYAAGRPDYPEALFSEIVRVCHLDPGAEVLEVGAGTGNFTAGVVGHGLSVTAVEPAPNMLRVLTERLGSESCRAIEARFENCGLQPHSFDAIFASHSWHWLDKSTRVARCTGLLRPGGHLGIVYNVHLGDEDPRFLALRRQVYARWAPEIEHLDPSSRKVDAARSEIAGSAAFEPVDELVVYWSHRFTATEFAALLGSYSNHIVLPVDRRSALLTDVQRLIEHELGGTVGQTFATVALISAVNAGT